MNTKPLTLSLPKDFSIEGENTIRFIGKDKSGNKTETDYYHFYYEPIPEIKSTPLITYSETVHKFYITYNPTTNKESLKQYVTKYKRVGIDEEYQFIYTPYIIYNTKAEIVIPSENLDSFKYLEIEIYPENSVGIAGKSKKYTIYNPPKVTNLTAIRNSEDPSSKIDISWNTPTEEYFDKVDHIKVIYWIGLAEKIDTKYVNVELDKNSTNYSITDIVHNQKYNISISCIIKDNLLTSTTSTHCYSAPSPVTNLTAEVTEDGKHIKLNWKNPPQEEDYSEIRISRYDYPYNGNWVPLTGTSTRPSIDKSVEQFTDIYLNENDTNNNMGHDYKYKIIIKGGWSLDNFSTESLVSISLPPELNNIQIIEQQKKYLVLSWEYMVDLDGIDIYYKVNGESDNNYKKISLSRRINLCKVDNLSPNTTYNFKLIPYKIHQETGNIYIQSPYYIDGTTTE